MLEERRSEFPLMILAEVWARITTKCKYPNKKASKCQSFSFVITQACLGFWGGYLDSTHKKAIQMIEGLENQRLDSEESVKVLYEVLKLYGLEKNA